MRMQTMIHGNTLLTVDVFLSRRVGCFTSDGEAFCLYSGAFLFELFLLSVEVLSYIFKYIRLFGIFF
jgi:hypothetical protein